MTMQAQIEMGQFGQRLKSAREMAGYSRGEVANLLGVSQAAISLWERGETFPSVQNLIKLTTLYHCSLDWLLKPVAA